MLSQSQTFPPQEIDLFFNVSFELAISYLIALLYYTVMQIRRVSWRHQRSSLQITRSLIWARIGFWFFGFFFPIFLFSLNLNAVLFDPCTI
jgi:hypothetical protein